MKNCSQKNIICLYGRRNDRHPPKGKPRYWTDWRALRAERERLTGRKPFWVNVTTGSTDPIFRAMSPMQMGPVSCYFEQGRMVTAVNVEVAWQFSKVFSYVKENGRLINVRERFITRDTEGNARPSAQWFAWRDAAYTNPRFVHTHPEFERNKMQVRRPFPGGSVVAFWYWDGKILDSVQARQQIYAALYEKFVKRTEGYKQLRRAMQRGKDVFIYDRDGYDWQRLGMTPADCLRAGHSFGHGMVTAFLLLGLEPTKLITNGAPHA